MKYSFQPQFPYNDVHHDSLQYHFIFECELISLRLFYTTTQTYISIFKTNIKNNTTNEIVSLELSPIQAQIDIPSGEFGCMKIDLDGKVSINETNRQEITWMENNKNIILRFESGLCTGWDVPGRSQGVIHRPKMKAYLYNSDGEEMIGVGYSKRYYGSYGPHWGYRFMHSVLLDEKKNINELIKNDNQIIWTADATFGVDKYNYWKSLKNNNIHEEMSCNTWHQDKEASFVKSNNVTKLKFTQLIGQEFKHRIKRNNTDCLLVLRWGHCELHAVDTNGNSKPIAYGIVFNEFCFGCVE
eukprot:GHVL01044991.1.p1 GENE.GHVL01044991.1~~GHVL01044991.1.p1  ORF type:complete len:299 (+),score=66.64 GHVL01044991.1:605-1501(+)